MGSPHIPEPSPAPEPPRTCRAPAVLPPELVLDARDAEGHAPETLMAIQTRLTCELEAHQDTPHAALVRLLPAPHGENLWTHWTDGLAPEQITALPDCTETNGAPSGRDDVCFLYRDHPGRCSFAIDAPGP
ncbi:hypothetical protein ACH4E8_24150 [Streptomyces sp. NPDC017979]|uniref:hypothetical protein n=1 Tax=Streptomyces sp. NPDC017979 TaxID=3365024 RepID=UPI0037884B83